MGDLCGTSVSLSSDGNTLAVGELLSDGNGINSGSVRVFQYTTGTWTQIGLTINGQTSGDRNGVSVSLSANGSVLAIGADYNAVGGVNSGSVRIFQNISGSWTQLGVTIYGQQANAQFGHKVSLSSDGTTVAIGNFGGNSVHIYKNTTGNWIQLGTAINGLQTDDFNGFSVSLSSDGSIVAIGAVYGDGLDIGYVRVFQNTSSNWIQVGATIDGLVADDFSGHSVSLSSDGSTVAIGAIGNDGSFSNAGSVRVYKNTLGTWGLVGEAINGEAIDDFSGWIVSLSSDGTKVAIGTPFNDGNGLNSGSVRVYQYTLGTWTKLGIDIDGESIKELNGRSVSLSKDGTKVAIGAPFKDINGLTDSGSVRVFDLTTILSSDNFVQANILVYPNPTSQNLTIGLQNGLEIQKINFYNNLGQKIKTATTITTSVADLAKGSYFVEVVTNLGKATKTIIVD